MRGLSLEGVMVGELARAKDGEIGGMHDSELGWVKAKGREFGETKKSVRTEEGRQLRGVKGGWKKVADNGSTSTKGAR